MKKTKKQNSRENVQLSNDERIVNRTNQRRRKNKRKKVILRSSLGIILLVTGVLLVIFLFFNINKISVTGDTAYSADQVIAASEVKNGDNLIFLSKSKINELITTKLPYVESVKIKRRLPAHLEIEVHKTVPCFGVAENGYYTLLNEKGKVLETELEHIGENVILLNGGKISSVVLGTTVVFENDKILPRLQEVNDACNSVGLTDITSVDISNIYNIKLVYQGRITLELGNTDGEKLVNKLKFGKSAIDRQNEENNQFRGSLNLTVDREGYLEEETTEPPTEPPIEAVTEPQSEPATDVSENSQTAEKPNEDNAENQSSAA